MFEPKSMDNIEDLLKLVWNALMNENIPYKEDLFLDLEDIKYEVTYGNYKIVQVDSRHRDGYKDYFVFKITDIRTDEDVYLCYYFYYDSWNGKEYIESKMVKPKEVIKIEWEEC